MARIDLQLQGYGLTTAEIFYRLPDYPDLLQLFLWQNYDLAPQFPELKRFLDFWTDRIEGRIHSVRVANKELITPGELKLCRHEFLIN